MANWKTVEEAKKNICPFLHPRKDDVSKLFHAVLCEADQCGIWHWRPCMRCAHGEYPYMDFDDDGKEYLHECPECNGTGSDGSGLGRCGLING